MKHVFIKNLILTSSIKNLILNLPMNQTHLCTYFLIDNSDIIRSNEIAQKQNHLRVQAKPPFEFPPKFASYIKRI